MRAHDICRKSGEQGGTQNKGPEPGGYSLAEPRMSAAAGVAELGVGAQKRRY
jgi:hypothetical protein